MDLRKELKEVLLNTKNGLEELYRAPKSLADAMAYAESALNSALGGANRSIAETAGAPVDLTNAMLGRIGLGQPKPVLGADWIADVMGQAGIANNGEGIPGILGGMGGAVAMPGAPLLNALDTAAAVTRAETVPQMLLAGAGGLFGEALSGLRRLPDKLDMTVYHGSPHKFDAFDLSKIGTGEGAQAFGHGLYFAESPGVAKSYQQKLTKGSPSSYIDSAGKPVWLDPQKLDDMAEARKYLFNVYGSSKQAITDEMISSVARKGTMSASTGQNAAQVQDGLKLLRMGLTEAPTNKGAFYHVDIPDEAIGKMLDWDKPLSEQPESVKAILRGSDIAPDESVWSQYTGQQLYEGEMQASGPYKASGWAASEAQKAVSEKLRSLGIPGIKYLDGGSRGAGDGTRNIVLFDDKLAKILKRE